MLTIFAIIAVLTAATLGTVLSENDAVGNAAFPTIGGIILYNILYAFVNEKGETAVYTSVLVGAVPYAVPGDILIIPAWVVEAGFIILLKGGRLKLIIIRKILIIKYRLSPKHMIDANPNSQTLATLGSICMHYVCRVSD